MYNIRIWIQCPEKWSEVVPDELEQAEVAIEVLVSQALQELFRVIMVEEVIITFLPPTSKWVEAQ
jgi:hypothetical protein